MSKSAEKRSSPAGAARASAEWMLHYGDCLVGLSRLGDGSIDVVITDPPWEAEAHTTQRLVARAGGKLAVEPLTFPPITEEQRAESARQMVRIARRWILVFCQVEAAQTARSSGKRRCQLQADLHLGKPDGKPQCGPAAKQGGEGNRDESPTRAQPLERRGICRVSSSQSRAAMRARGTIGEGRSRLVELPARACSRTLAQSLAGVRGFGDDRGRGDSSWPPIRRVGDEREVHRGGAETFQRGESSSCSTSERRTAPPRRVRCSLVLDWM